MDYGQNYNYQIKLVWTIQSIYQKVYIVNYYVVIMTQLSFDPTVVIVITFMFAYNKQHEMNFGRMIT